MQHQSRLLSAYLNLKAVEPFYYPFLCCNFLEKKKNNKTKQEQKSRMGANVKRRKRRRQPGRSQANANATRAPRQRRGPGAEDTTQVRGVTSAPPPEATAAAGSPVSPAAELIYTPKERLQRQTDRKNPLFTTAEIKKLL